MQVCNIIGCGQTAKEWNGQGYSIGVNDCWKYGLTTDRLIVVNNLQRWPERHKTVINSRPKDGLFSQIRVYCQHQNYKHIGTWHRWKGRFIYGSLYYSITSPFIAISMAHNMGFDKIVLYGVDFVDHATVRGSSLKNELRQYDSFCKELAKNGTNVYLGVQFGALTQILKTI